MCRMASHRTDIDKDRLAGFREAHIERERLGVLQRFRATRIVRTRDNMRKTCSRDTAEINEVQFRSYCKHRSHIRHPGLAPLRLSGIGLDDQATFDLQLHLNWFLGLMGNQSVLRDPESVLRKLLN